MCHDRALHAWPPMREHRRLRCTNMEMGRSDTAEDGGVTDLTSTVWGNLLKKHDVNSSVQLQGQSMCVRAGPCGEVWSS